MKSFCILEQGGNTNEALTLKKKKMFNTEFSDFYRLNWRDENDPNAFIVAKGVSWSEGRSLLYEKVPENYEYYIFIDDDVDFHADSDIDIPQKIKSLLEECRPIAATFYMPNAWHFTEMNLPEESFLSKKYFPIAGFDEIAIIFSKSFAEIMFPVPYHGEHRTTWYCEWVCHSTFPLKQMCFTEVWVTGARSGGHTKLKTLRRHQPTEILYLFNRHIKNKSLALKQRSQIAQNNLAVFNRDIDKNEINFALKDLKKVYNIYNIDWTIRDSIASKLYFLRRPWNRFWWKVVRRLTGEYKH